jgi:hypothetical protein
MKSELRRSLDKLPKGKKMPKGTWYLISPEGKVFRGTNVHSQNIAQYRVALFRVPKR